VVKSIFQTGRHTSVHHFYICAFSRKLIIFKFNFLGGNLESNSGRSEHTESGNAEYNSGYGL